MVCKKAKTDPFGSVFFITCSGGRIRGGKEDKYGKKSVFMGFRAGRLYASITASRQLVVGSKRVRNQAILA